MERASLGGTLNQGEACGGAAWGQLCGVSVGVEAGDWQWAMLLPLRPHAQRDPG